MGALHAGHVSLIEAAKARADETVVSIFVNPTQFRPGEDFERYPRSPERDLQLCEASGADLVFMPTVEVMYPAGEGAVSVHVGAVGDRWEGPARPGHFDGVATVVTQLFLAVRPNLAVFSVKDLQQCAVLGKLAAALRLGVELHLAPTLREADGLAMSSRNRYLSSEQRAIAPQLYQVLLAAKKGLSSAKGGELEAILKRCAAELDSRLHLLYLALVNRETMEPTKPDDTAAWLIGAVLLGGTRLIDNIALHE